ncbi:hypothetical protein IVB14_16310 [Bradyrhizobium sp. 180]|nr:hypothetical protein [Bradyrhizobium sp. 180]
MEITYILMAHGFADLAVVLDCAARRGLSWRLSITMKQPSASNAGVFLGSSRQAGHLQRGSGSQFIGQAFTGVLADNVIAISMDGTAHGETTCLSNGSGATSNTRRCARYDSVSRARSPIGLYLNFHNSRRPHSGHGGSTPDQTYFTRCHSVWQPNAPAAVPSIDAETTGTSSISLEGHSNGDTLPMLQFPDLYRSATCSVMKVAAKEEVREQHDQRHVIRQPGLRSTESMHGRTIVRLTESLAVLSSRRPVSLSRSNWQLRTSRCRAKPKSFGWSEGNSPETGSRLE